MSDREAAADPAPEEMDVPVPDALAQGAANGPPTDVEDPSVPAEPSQNPVVPGAGGAFDPVPVQPSDSQAQPNAPHIPDPVPSIAENAETEDAVPPVPVPDAAPAQPQNAAAHIAPALQQAPQQQASPSTRNNQRMPPSLEKLLTKMNSLAAEGNWTEIATAVRSSEDVLTKKLSELEQFMFTLDPSKHTAAFVMCLYVMLDVAERDNVVELQQRAVEIASYIIPTLDREQINTMLPYYCNIFHRLHDIFVHVAEGLLPTMGVPLIIAGIEKLVDRGSKTITSLHSMLFSLCVRSGSHELLEQVLPFVEVEIRSMLNENGVAQNVTELAKMGAKPTVDAVFVLIYLVCGGELLTEAGRFEEATMFFANAITFPAQALHPLQLTAHKKWTLLQLLLDEDPTPLPGQSPHMVRAWKECGEIYVKIVEACNMEGDIVSRIEAIKNKNRAKIIEDRCLGVIERLQQVLRERRLFKIIRCFSAIQLPELARRTYIEQEELTRLIAELKQENRLEGEVGEIAQLRVPKSPIGEDHVDNALKRVDYLQSQLANTHEAIQFHPLYIWRTQRHDRPLHLPGVPPAQDDEGLSMSMMQGTSAVRD